MEQQRIEFANSLRGIAAFIVMLVHYVVMFNYLRGAYGGFTALDFEPYPYLVPAIHFWLPYLDYGSLGVALFFLVSGFVIPFSLEKFGPTVRGRCAFLVARAFRLWPTYLACMVITIGALLVIGILSGIPRHFGALSVAAQFSLFRDWVGSSEIGGVTWTLEIEVKFYLLMAVFGTFLLHRPWLVFIPMLLLAAWGGYLHIELPQAGFEWTNLLFAPRYMSFMLIGTAFHLLLLRRMSALEVAALTTLTLTVFWAYNYASVSPNFVLAVIIFAVCFVLRRHFRPNAVLSFFARISYPLYVLHAAFGYLGLRVMMGAGMLPPVALVVQMAVTVTVAYGMHRLVEVPSREAGRRISEKIAELPKLRNDGAVIASDPHISRAANHGNP